MAKSAKTGPKPDAVRKRKPKPGPEHVLRKPDIMEPEAVEEAKKLITRIGKDWDTSLKRTVASLARKHGVTEAFVFTALSHHLMVQALEVATANLVDDPLGGHATDD